MQTRVMYIGFINLNDRNGYSVLCMSHLRMLKRLFPDSLFSYVIGNSGYEAVYKQFGDPSSIRKCINVLFGYTPKYNWEIVYDICRTIKKYHIDVIFVDNSISGKLLKRIKRNNEVKIISFFHDIEAVKMRKDERRSAVKDFAKHVYYYNERLNVKFSDDTIVLNNRDCKEYIEQYGDKPSLVLPICVPFKKIDTNRRHISNCKIKMLFVGVDYSPNVEGVRWFIDEVFPCVKGFCSLAVVGYGMEKYRREFSVEGVSIIGTVDELSQYYIEHDVVIGPIRHGGGMKVKTAEAFSYGKPFIGCTESLEGYWESIPKELKDKYIFRANCKEDYYTALLNLYTNEFESCISEIYDWAEREYSLDHNISKLKGLINKPKE